MKSRPKDLIYLAYNFQVSNVFDEFCTNRLNGPLKTSKKISFNSFERFIGSKDMMMPLKKSRWKMCFQMFLMNFKQINSTCLPNRPDFILPKIQAGSK